MVKESMMAKAAPVVKYTPVPASKTVNKGGAGDGEGVTGMGVAKGNKTVTIPKTNQGSNN